MNDKFHTQLTQSGTPFFQPHQKSPFVVGVDQEGQMAFPSIGRMGTENSENFKIYKAAKSRAKLDGLDEPPGYSSMESEQTTMATLTQNPLGDWDIEDFLLGGLPDGADTEAVREALKSHVSLAMDDQEPYNPDPDGESLDTVLGDEVSEVPTMSDEQVMAELESRGLKSIPNDGDLSRQRLTSAILTDVASTRTKYMSGQFQESLDEDSPEADFQGLDEMFSETVGIGVRTNGEEDWDGDSGLDGQTTYMGGQLASDSANPYPLGEADSAELLIAASDGEMMKSIAEQKVVGRYFEEAFKKTTTTSQDNPAYGNADKTGVGLPVGPPQKSETDDVR